MFCKCNSDKIRLSKKETPQYFGFIRATNFTNLRTLFHQKKMPNSTTPFDTYFLILNF